MSNEYYERSFFNKIRHGDFQYHADFKSNAFDISKKKNINKIIMPILVQLANKSEIVLDKKMEMIYLYNSFQNMEITYEFDDKFIFHQINFYSTGKKNCK